MPGRSDPETFYAATENYTQTSGGTLAEAGGMAERVERYAV